MGTYCYTMRKRQQGFNLPSGHRAFGRLFSYAYKPSYAFCLAGEHNRRVAALDSAAERAFDTYDGGYVIMGDLEDGVDGLVGAVVYEEVTRCCYYDSSDRFPGKAVGLLELRGRKLHLVTETKWETRGDTSREFREVVRDGEHKHEARFARKRIV